MDARRKLSVAIAAAWMTVLAGCGSGSPVRPSAMEETPPALLDGRNCAEQAALNDLYAQGEWNAVLNYDHLGITALRAGDLKLAGAAFDAAIERIDAVYADNPAAKKARSVWTSEGTKDFKGEPHERAMTFFYRGLVDLAEGDFENARAAFKSADFQSTLSQQEEFANDFNVAIWLEGWASHCDGREDMAEEAYSRAMQKFAGRDYLADWLKESINAERFHGRSANRTVVVVERGSGPGKVGSGQYKEMLKASPGSIDHAVQLHVLRAGAVDNFLDYRNAPPSEAVEHWDKDRTGGGTQESLSYQASTRGGRQVDAILDGKAQFKSTTNAVGKTGLAAGTQLMATGMLTNNNQMQQLGGAFALVGMFASMASSATKPSADTRYWQSLPDYLGVGDVSIGIDEPVVVRQHDFDTSLTKTIAPILDKSANGCRLIVVSDGAAPEQLSALAQYGSVAEGERRKIARRNRDRDAQFHAALVQSLTPEASGGSSVAAAASTAIGTE